jgi:hypothetical protein
MHRFYTQHTHIYIHTDAERDIENSEKDIEGELLGQLQELHRQLAEVCTCLCVSVYVYILVCLQG